MDLEGLRGFLAVLESGSFVSASRSLRWARATLRRRIDELEVSTGTKLLHRTGSGAVPTDAGVLLAQRGRLMIAEAEAMVAAVRELGASPTGLLRVLLPVGLPPELVVAIVGQLRQRLPELRLHFRYSDNPVGDLSRGSDVAILFGDRPTAGPWITREIGRLPVHLVGSREYLARRGVPKHATDLAAHDVLWWTGASGNDHTAIALKAGGTFPVTPVLQSSDVHLLRRMAANGLGLAYAPDGGPDEFGLVPVLDHEVGTTSALRIVLASLLDEVPRIRLAFQMVEEFLPQHATNFSAAKASAPRARKPR